MKAKKQTATKQTAAAAVKTAGTNGKSNKGETTSVEPIRDLQAIANIKKLLSAKGQERNQLLFVLGINNGIRTGDLLRLRVGDVLGLRAGDSFTIKESKTGKQNTIAINKSCDRALRAFFSAPENQDIPATDYLFKSRKGGNQPLTTFAVNRLIKSWTAAIGLKGTYGAHTLRKTFGYVQRTVYGVGFDVLCRRYNHSSPAITMRYLGISSAEVNSILMNEI